MRLYFKIEEENPLTECSELQEEYNSFNAETEEKIRITSPKEFKMTDSSVLIGVQG